MSQQLISRNPDLKRLRDEGYDVEVRANHLLVKHVPYANAKREVQFGTLVSELSLAGNVTTKPGTHVAHFMGEHPCDSLGAPIERIRHQSEQQDLGNGIVTQHSFSSKPNGGYQDHYEKMVTYVAILSAPARAIDPGVTATTFPAIQADSDDSVFVYLDTASSRAGISCLNAKLEGDCVAILGLGGTGSYVLDLLAKTPVREIHLFDHDIFSQHNAFRSPGAPSLQELQSQPRKVDYLQTQYSRMRRQIVAHDCFVDGSNLDQLNDMTFVFLCMDDGEAKRPIVAHLEAENIPFIDVGLGVQCIDSKLFGIVRVTTSTPMQRSHVHEKGRVPFTGGGTNEYCKNIQIADLNALNAALAVIKWKKVRGFYADLEQEHFSAYTIDGNTLTNEDNPCPPG
ncbi:MAG: ThiF family adenylyltransferase [Phycisphaerae bacterium]|nr:ThiF family adenylyltransferase [Phycisphaerae bacterium]